MISINRSIVGHSVGESDVRCKTVSKKATCPKALQRVDCRKIEQVCQVVGGKNGKNGLVIGQNLWTAYTCDKKTVYITDGQKAGRRECMEELPRKTKWDQEKKKI